jgi:hypothetical protein
MFAICDWWCFWGVPFMPNISSSQYQVNKLDIGMILSSWWIQYGIFILRFKHQLSLFPLPPHIIVNRLMIRHWYRIYHCDNERKIWNQMAFPTYNEISTWLYIYGMASKQSRMCVHVWRPWKITHKLLTTDLKLSHGRTHKFLATTLQMLHWRTCKLLSTISQLLH